MLEMRPGCEHCDCDLPANAGNAYICSFECTFCQVCTEKLSHVCPNCGGELTHRPSRSDRLLSEYPASTRRIYKPTNV